jgi:hypothetical protein
MTFFTTIFSVVCGLLLVQIIFPLYFKLFLPIPKSLHNFYIATGIVIFLLLIFAAILFKKGKYNWGILIILASAIFFSFGIPIFMLENNEMLWHVAVFSKPGPVYFIEFSDQELYILKSISNLYQSIWDMVRYYIFAYLVIYPAAYVYLVKNGWRIKGIRIK